MSQKQKVQSQVEHAPYLGMQRFLDLGLVLSKEVQGAVEVIEPQPLPLGPVDRLDPPQVVNLA